MAKLDCIGNCFAFYSDRHDSQRYPIQFVLILGTYLCMDCKKQNSYILSIYFLQRLELDLIFDNFFCICPCHLRFFLNGAAVFKMSTCITRLFWPSHVATIVGSTVPLSIEHTSVLFWYCYRLLILQDTCSM